MEIGAAAIEQVETDGSVRTLRLAPRPGEFLVVALPDEYDEPRDGPLHFLDPVDAARYVDAFASGRVRRAGPKKFRRDGPRLFLSLEWRGIRARNEGVTLYVLSLPQDAVIDSLEISDPDRGSAPRARYVLRDDAQRRFIVYVEAAGLLEFDLNCELTIAPERFFEATYTDPYTRPGNAFTASAWEVYVRPGVRGALFEEATDRRVSGRPQSDDSERKPRMEIRTDWTNDIADYKGKIHFAIITIKPEEEDEVLDRFPRQHTIRGQRDYGLCRTENIHGDRILVATVRQPRQGNTYATSLTKDVISDLDPGWILLVGIAGATPFGDAVLGDVVLGTHVHDLTVQARNPDGTTEFSAGGGAATADVEATVVHLRSTLKKTVSFPRPKKELNLAALTYTTDDKEVNKKIEDALGARFEGGYTPRILDGQIISTDALVKDVDLVKQWKTPMRSALAIEMESAGAHHAARTRAKTYAMLPIRGISDIVGLKKQEGWVLHACKVAAECALQLVKQWTPERREAEFKATNPR